MSAERSTPSDPWEFIVPHEVMTCALVGEIVLRHLDAIHAQGSGDVTHIVAAMLTEVEEALAARRPMQ